MPSTLSPLPAAYPSTGLCDDQTDEALNRCPSFVLFAAASFVGETAKSVEEGDFVAAVEIVVEKHVFDDMKAAPDDGVLDERKSSITKSGERVRDDSFDI